MKHFAEMIKRRIEALPPFIRWLGRLAHSMLVEERLTEAYTATAGETKDTANDWEGADTAWPDSAPCAMGGSDEPKTAEYGHSVKCPKCGLEAKICCEKHLKDWYCGRCRAWLDGHGTAGSDEPVLGHRGGT